MLDSRRIIIFSFINLIATFTVVSGIVEVLRYHGVTIGSIGLLGLILLGFLVQFVVFIFFAIELKQKPYLHAFCLLFLSMILGTLMKFAINPGAFEFGFNWRISAINIVVASLATYIGFKKNRSIQ